MTQRAQDLGIIIGQGTPGPLNAITDVPGVLDKDKKLIPELTVEDCRRLIADGTITGGVIPKIETCMYAIERGVEAVVILDGKVNHAVLLELFTDYGLGKPDLGAGDVLGEIIYISGRLS